MATINWTQKRINRAWTMYLRARERGDEVVAAQWMSVWQNLCNEVIAQTEVTSDLSL